MISAGPGCTIQQARPFDGKGCDTLTAQEFRRAHMKLGDDAPYEDSFVLWLQAGCFFADIRARLDGSVYSGFGGVIEWNAPVVYFRHLINMSGELSTTDIGTLRFEPWGCFEYGSFERDGRTIHFEEKWWARPTSGAAVFSRRERGVLTGLEVQTDRYCVVVESTSVQAFERRGHAWRSILRSDGANRFRRPIDGRLPGGWQPEESVAR